MRSRQHRIDLQPAEAASFTLRFCFFLHLFIRYDKICDAPSPSRFYVDEKRCFIVAYERAQVFRASEHVEEEKKGEMETRSRDTFAQVQVELVHWPRGHLSIIDVFYIDCQF